MTKVVFKLYILGRTANSEQAVASLRRICKENVKGIVEPEVEVIDLREFPEVAEQEKILATPTLVKVSPPPLRRIVGDLSDTRAVLQELGLGGEKSDSL